MNAVERTTARLAGRTGPCPGEHPQVELRPYASAPATIRQRGATLRSWWLVCALAACGGPASEPGVVVAAPSYDGRNRALSFDGANDYATTGSAAFPVANAPQTICAWVRPARSSAPDAGDSGAAGDDPQALISLRKDDESGVVVGLRRGAFEAWSVYSGRTYARASTPALVNVWQHVSYTYDGTMHRIFVDGHQLDAGTSEPNNRTPTTGWLGSLDGTHNLFVGELDEVAVYTVALDPSVIAAQAIRTRTTTVPTESAANLVLWLGFDEVFGSKAFDRSGRGNDALLGDGISAHMPERLLEP